MFIGSDVPQMHRELMMKSTMASTIQCLLIFLIISERPSLDDVYLGGVNINCSRLICGILLHMSVVPEVRCGIEQMDFVIRFPETFKGSECLAFLIGLMKLFGVILTEFANVTIIVRS